LKTAVPVLFGNLHFATIPHAFWFDGFCDELGLCSMLSCRPLVGHQCLVSLLSALNELIFHDSLIQENKAMSTLQVDLTPNLASISVHLLGIHLMRLAMPSLSLVSSSMNLL